MTVYGAVSETITLTSSLGTFTISTNSVGTGTGAIYAPNSGSISYTVRGSVSGYSKTVSVSMSTTTIYAMQNGALYWYGNQCTWITGGSTSDGWLYATSGSSYDEQDCIYNTNSISFPVTQGVARIWAPVNNISFSGYSRLYAHVISATLYGDNAGKLGVDNVKNASQGTATVWTAITGIGTWSVSVSGISSEQPFLVSANASKESNRQIVVDSVWLA